MRRPAAVGVSAALVVVLAALAFVVAQRAGRRERPPGSPPAGLTASATQTRPDEAAGHRFQVKVDNAGSAPVTVTGLQLRSPGFRAAPFTAREETFPPGIAYDLPAPYGDVDCRHGVDPLRVVLTLREGDRTRQVLVPLRSDDGLMARIHAGECRQQALAGQVAVSLAGALTPDGPQALRGVLHVQRRATREGVAVDSVTGSVIYDVRGERLPAVLAADAAATDVPVHITMATCMAHNIAETKKPYVFLLFVRVGNEPPVATAIPVTAAQRGQLDGLVRTGCAGRPG